MGMHRHFGCTRGLSVRARPMVTPVTIGGVRFESQRAAMRATGLSRTTIHKVVKYGHEVKRINASDRKGQRRVIHLPTGREFGSIAEAAEAIGVNKSTAYNGLRGNGSAHGLEYL